MPEEDVFSFGPFRLDAAQRVLLQADVPLRLTPREIDVLITLVVHHGDLVEKSLFFDRVWRGLCVEDCNLSQHVAALRRVLGDDAHKPIYIETVPRRGYRFVAPVARTSRATLGPAIASPPAVTPPPLALLAAPPATTPAPLDGPAPAADPAHAVAPRAARRSVESPRTWAALLAVVALGATAGWKVFRPKGAAAQRAAPAVAVLPVANLTGDAHHDHLAQTLTAGLLHELGEVRGVGARPARPSSEDADAAREAEALVEIALLSVDGHVRLAAELMDAKTRRLLWAEVLETDELSVDDAERRIAAEIAGRLIPSSSAADGGSAGARGEAQRECALARQYLERRSPQVVEEALEHFRTASRRDPRYGPALVGLADAYLLGLEQRVLPPAEALSGAEVAARRALELDRGLAGAHAALGAIAAARWDFEKAEALYRRALAIDPSVAITHERYAALLTVLDRHAEAVAQARVARDLNPACPAAATGLAAAYYHSGQSDAAIEQALAALRLTPRFAAAYDVLGWAHQAKGRLSEAVAAFREAVRLSEGSPTYEAALARATARAGGADEARRLLAELQRTTREREASPLDLAQVFEALGDSGRALEQVERAAATGAPWLQRVDSGLSLVSLHDHARFRALVSRMRRAAAGSAAGPEAASPRPPGPGRLVRPASETAKAAVATSGQ